MAGRVVSLLTSWVTRVARHPIKVLCLVALVTAGAGITALTQFRLNSNLGQLIAQNASWRVDFDHFESTFPDLLRTSVVVLNSTSVADLERATQSVVRMLEAHREFRAVNAPGSERWFRDHALLYANLDDLESIADRLAEAQPWLTAVAADPGLRSVAELVGEGLDNDPPEGFGRVVGLLGQSAVAEAAGQSGRISWTDELFPLDAPRFQLVSVKADPMGSLDTDAKVVETLRAELEALNLPDSVNVRLTGEIPLQYEEIQAAVGGVTLAGWLCLVLLLAVLVIGVRSLKIVVATFTMLGTGIIWCMAYALLSVGEFNTLSLVFIVMFFGLGVDFALHFSLRYQEAFAQNTDDSLPIQERVTTALGASTLSVGRAISLCTLTTALGFFGFWPTEYKGLADLGVISAGGMVIAWFLTFTLLPALFAVMGPVATRSQDIPTGDRVVEWLISHRPWVLASVLLGGLAASWVATSARFDYSVLALKDESSESMSTLRVLQAEGLSTDYQLVALDTGQHADGQPYRAIDVAALNALDTVAEVQVPDDFVPQDQDEKLEVVEDLQLLLWSAVEPVEVAPPASTTQLRDALTQLLNRVTVAVNAKELPALQSELETLERGLSALLAGGDEQLLSWQGAVTSNLLDELAWLRRALVVDEVTFGDLPPSARQRLVAQDGASLTVIKPAHDISEVSALSEFIASVRSVAPQATGRPVVEWGVGGIVLSSFQQALLFAVVSITLVILLVMRSFRNTGLIILPLMLTAIGALAFGVLADQQVNMASILVWPLIFGLGVDNGIHVVDRYLGEGDVEHLMHSSTPRAVVLSTLTTFGAFAALSLSPHAGTASIGMLLAVSIGLLLLFTIFLLPVLLAKAGRQGMG